MWGTRGQWERLSSPFVGKSVAEAAGKPAQPSPWCAHWETRGNTPETKRSVLEAESEKLMKQRMGAEQVKKEEENRAAINSRFQVWWPVSQVSETHGQGFQTLSVYEVWSTGGICKLCEVYSWKAEGSQCKPALQRFYMKNHCNGSFVRYKSKYRQKQILECLVQIN